ncbi:MAG TPA: SRPBCC family protein [Gemmatimonadales bacterium]|nr:SRPBCC family protein [Gemmatimonadales bacterium]
MRRASVAWIGAAFVALAVLFVGGLLLPERYEISRRLVVSRPPEAVWYALTDSLSLRRWRKDLIALERVGDRNGWPVWREIGDDGVGTEVEVVEATPPAHLRLRRQGERARGTTEWEYLLERVPEGIALTVVERGTISSPVRRFLVQFLAGAHGRLDRQLAGLAEHLDEPVRIE